MPSRYAIIAPERDISVASVHSIVRELFDSTNPDKTSDLSHETELLQDGCPPDLAAQDLILHGEKIHAELCTTRVMTMMMSLK
jgi:hypothetical protein